MWGIKINIMEKFENIFFIWNDKIYINEIFF
jgi:hypothetical protein